MALAALACCTPASLVAADGAILPKSFAGWSQSGAAVSADPAAADPAHPAVVKEYGFQRFESAAFRRGDNHLAVKAIRFADASGAYGAFTFYKQPEMLTEKIGDQGAALDNLILFYRGNVLVQATLEHLTAMSAADLRELSDAIPLPAGPARNLPSLPQYLPRKGYVNNSAKFALGPAALTIAGSPLPVERIGFERSAEVVEGRYSTRSGTATLVIVSYPTPQIAADQLRAFSALNQNPPPAAEPSLAAPFVCKRSGPLVACVAGQASDDEAHALLSSVNYDADVTWNENTHFDKKNNVANLLVNIVYLVLILIAFALVIGVAFGGFRILMKHLFPGRVFDRPEEMEFIRLKIDQRGKAEKQDQKNQ
jgi:hypothetical protein